MSTFWNILFVHVLVWPLPGWRWPRKVWEQSKRKLCEMSGAGGHHHTTTVKSPVTKSWQLAWMVGYQAWSWRLYTIGQVTIKVAKSKNQKAKSFDILCETHAGDTKYQRALATSLCNLISSILPTKVAWLFFEKIMKLIR